MPIAGIEKKERLVHIYRVQ